MKAQVKYVVESISNYRDSTGYHAAGEFRVTYKSVGPMLLVGEGSVVERVSYPDIKEFDIIVNSHDVIPQVGEHVIVELDMSDCLFQINEDEEIEIEAGSDEDDESGEEEEANTEYE